MLITLSNKNKTESSGTFPNSLRFYMIRVKLQSIKRQSIRLGLNSFFLQRLDIWSSVLLPRLGVIHLMLFGEDC